MHDESIKHIGDALSVSLVVATVASWLPAIAAVLSIIWTIDDSELTDGIGA